MKIFVLGFAFWGISVCLQVCVGDLYVEKYNKPECVAVGLQCIGIFMMVIGLICWATGASHECL